MPRGKTKSKKTLAERRELAGELFAKQQSVAFVAKRLGVSWETAKSYKVWWEEQIAEEAASNPGLLRDTLRNTVAQLRELDLVIKEAWKIVHATGRDGDGNLYQTGNQTRLQALNTIRQASADKAKLYGLFGVKQDYFQFVQSVNAIQARLLEFMGETLCPSDREALAELLEGELAQHMAITSGLPMIEAAPEEPAA